MLMLPLRARCTSNHGAHNASQPSSLFFLCLRPIRPLAGEYGESYAHVSMFPLHTASHIKSFSNTVLLCKFSQLISSKPVHRRAHCPTRWLAVSWTLLQIISMAAWCPCRVCKWLMLMLPALRTLGRAAATLHPPRRLTPPPVAGCISCRCTKSGAMGACMGRLSRSSHAAVECRMATNDYCQGTRHYIASMMLR
jgi:hypothetical protein